MLNLPIKPEQIQRYSRHIILQDVGTPGVKKLLNATVCVVGAGGLGCPVIQMLSTAGIGHIKIIDGDKVELSNLPRQPLHFTSDIGQFKVDSIIQKVKALNPDVKMEGIRTFLTKENASEILQGCDYVIDASDNFATKFLINDVCVHLQIPFNIAGVVQWMGQLISVEPGVSTCYRCVFHTISAGDDSMSCSSAGVINTIPSFAGILQANECIKSILGKRRKFLNGVFFFDLGENSFDFVPIKRNPKCKACSDTKNAFYKSETYERDGDQCEIIQ
ncbi:MAG: HesA/MoeB/ThiF family protein [Promethearchaeota archaeon]